MNMPRRLGACGASAVLVALVALATSLGALGGGCNIISGIGDFDVVDAGKADGPTMLPLQCDGQSCSGRADCPADNDCQTWSCNEGTCCRAAFPAGTESSVQTPGDCKKNVCDDTGVVTAVADDTDLPDDGKECSVATCAKGIPQHTPKEIGTVCVGGTCDASGACVTCLVDGDCGVQFPQCQTAVCNNGVCGVTSMNGPLPPEQQIAGDCISVVCSAGMVGVTADTMDPASDGRECTQDVCNGMTPTNPPKAAGTPCTEGSGKVCDGLGNCVECAVDGDCATSHCSAGVCVSAQCTDVIKNGTETDIDCGGSACAPCADGKACAMGTDCQSGVCNGTCQAPTCSDGVKNGAETDVDCGGPTCGPTSCGAGKACLANLDCASEVCISGKCGQITQIACGNSHACALVDGNVHCWGYNLQGQLGDGATVSRTQPHLVPGLSGVTQISLGNNAEQGAVLDANAHTAALQGGAVKVWGLNHYGQCGIGTTAPTYAPPANPVLTGVSAIATFGATTCALMTDGAVRCWGLNNNGELGDGTATSVTDRKQPPASGIPGLAAKSIAAGDSHACVITSTGSVKCWGDNNYGELGQGNITGSENSPQTVNGLLGALQVVAGARFSCALMPGGSAKCWGDNSSGELGNGNNNNDKDLPVSVLNLTGAQSLAAGSTQDHGGHVCAVMTGGALQCWGANNHGQLGNGNITKASTPQPITVGAPVAKVSLGLDFSCALLTTGALRCWGTNNRGQLGTGNYTEQHTPTPVVWP